MSTSPNRLPLATAKKNFSSALKMNQRSTFERARFFQWRGDTITIRLIHITWRGWQLAFSMTRTTCTGWERQSASSCNMPRFCMTSDTTSRITIIIDTGCI